jgi:hypothetical protein
MAQSLEIWRRALSMAEVRFALSQWLAEGDLSAPEETDITLIELSRRFPNLPREIAEYLAR